MEDEHFSFVIGERVQLYVSREPGMIVARTLKTASDGCEEPLYSVQMDIGLTEDHWEQELEYESKR